MKQKILAIVISVFLLASVMSVFAEKENKNEKFCKGFEGKDKESCLQSVKDSETEKEDSTEQSDESETESPTDCAQLKDNLVAQCSEEQKSYDEECAQATGNDAVECKKEQASALAECQQQTEEAMKECETAQQEQQQSTVGAQTAVAPATQVIEQATLPTSPDAVKITNQPARITLKCDGCDADNKCIPIGTRSVENQIAGFCDVDKVFKSQKQNTDACQNNYECASNTCSNSVCKSGDENAERIASLEKELKAQRTILQKILDFFTSWFK